VCACLLAYLGICSDAQEALTLFARQRTHDSKGVTIPSQIRYVRRFAHLLSLQSGGPGVPRSPPKLTAPVMRIRGLRVCGCPTFDLTGGCDP
jgi:phosphatidylinositol-3,4,5-trisphosphate 3-phosphatase/dual-specificity protein phosphatase PTEN